MPIIKPFGYIVIGFFGCLYVFYSLWFNLHVLFTMVFSWQNIGWNFSKPPAMAFSSCVCGLLAPGESLKSLNGGLFFYRENIQYIQNSNSKCHMPWSSYLVPGPFAKPSGSKDASNTEEDEGLAEIHH